MSSILVIDSDSAESQIMRSRMSDVGHRVTVCDSGARGLLAVREGSFDLIVLASGLKSGVGGDEVCRRLKAIPDLRAVPVLMYSTQSDAAGAADRAYDAGCDVFLGKAQIATLDQVAQYLLRLKHRADELSSQLKMVDHENRRLKDELCALQRENGASMGGNNGRRSPLAARPDVLMLVDGNGYIRYADNGAFQRLGARLEGKPLSALAPGSGLGAFVLDTRIVPREGFRFDISRRAEESSRSYVASVYPLTDCATSDSSGLRAVLLDRVGKGEVVAAADAPSEAPLSGQLRQELFEAARSVYAPGEIVGASEASTKLRKRVLELAETSRPVWIDGEEGSGKEWIAHSLHFNRQIGGTLRTIHCGALTAENLRKELFGFVKGAFPDAKSDRLGLLHMAHGGTLLLKDVADLPSELQIELAEVVSTGRFSPIGSERSERVDVRFVATSVGEAEHMLEEGRLHRGLFARFAEARISVPPLRERREDVYLLAQQLIRRHARGSEVPVLAVDARWIMDQYGWPGNLSELDAAVEQACSEVEGTRIRVIHLSRELRDLYDELASMGQVPPEIEAGAEGLDQDTIPAGDPPRGFSAAQPVRPTRPWDISDDDPISLDLYERKGILRALDSCGGDKIATARLLKVGKSTLYRKLKRFGIK